MTDLQSEMWPLRPLVGCLGSSLILVCCWAFDGCQRLQTESMSLPEIFVDLDVLSLARATETGDISAIQHLLGRGLNINSVGRGNTSILTIALRAKNKQSYLYLLEQGADPNILDDRGLAVTNLSASESDSFWLDQALRHGGNPNLLSKGNY